MQQKNAKKKMTKATSKNEGIPGYLRVKKDIRAGLDANRWQKGGRIPNESELAKLYGVSRATVARGIKELVKDGLLLRIKGTGTFQKEDIPSGAETSMSPPARSTRIIMLCNDIRDLAQYPLSDIIQGMQDGIEKHANTYLQPFAVINSSILREENKPVFNLIKAGAAGGLITLYRFPPADFEHYLQQGIPVIRLNSQGLDEGVCTVSTDFFAGAYDVIRHLNAMGHTKIGLVGTLNSARSSLQDMSIRGYKFAMAHLKSGQKEKIILLPRIGNGEESKIIRSSLPDLLQCSALYVANDAVAFWVDKALKQKKHRVALVGCGDYLKDRMKKTTISSLSFNNHAIGKSAVELLLRMIHGEEIGIPSVLIKPELIIRESSAFKHA